MHTDIVPELTLASIALDIGAPPAPALIPSDPAEALAECQRYHQRCVLQEQHARTPEDRLEAQIWVINAERQVARWQAAVARQATR